MSRPGTPGTPTGGSIKQKLVALAVRLDAQEKTVAQQRSIFASVEEENQKLRALIAQQAESVNSRITREVIDLKEDTAHKFSLQVAENKRLQHHISLQKQETQKLYKQIEALQGRLLAVERELGDV